MVTPSAALTLNLIYYKILTVQNRSTLQEFNIFKYVVVKFLLFVFLRINIIITNIMECKNLESGF